MRSHPLTRARTAGRWIGVCALAAGVVACVRVERAADRHVNAMQEAIGDIQAARDRDERPLDSEMDDALFASEPPPRAAKGAASTAAPLRSVHIGHSEGAAVEDADPNDPGSRPEIRLHGTSRYPRAGGPSGPKENP